MKKKEKILKEKLLDRLIDYIDKGYNIQPNDIELLKILTKKRIR